MRGTTIGQASELYLQGRVARGEISAQTAAKVRIGLRQLTDAVGDKPVRKLSKQDAEAWLAHTQTIGNIASTRRQRWSHLNVFCEWCVDEELMDRNPFRRVKPPKPPRKVARTLSREEVARVLAVAPSVRDQLIIILMVQEGLRCAGVSSLQVDDVDLQRRHLRVCEKFGHERVISVTEECCEYIGRYLSRYPAERGPLIRAWSPNRSNQAGFPEASDRALSAGTISKFVSEWMWEAGVKQAPRDGRSAHAFRRTCATDMLENGADIVAVRDTLGHRSLATTNDYIGSAAGRLEGAMGGRRYSRPVEAG